MNEESTRDITLRILVDVHRELGADFGIDLLHEIYQFELDSLYDDNRESAMSDIRRRVTLVVEEMMNRRTSP
jgi:hypothetical protein